MTLSGVRFVYCACFPMAKPSDQASRARPWFAAHWFTLWFAWRRKNLTSPLPANDWQGHGWTFWHWRWTGSVEILERLPVLLAPRRDAL